MRDSNDLATAHPEPPGASVILATALSQNPSVRLTQITFSLLKSTALPANCRFAMTLAIPAKGKANARTSGPRYTSPMGSEILLGDCNAFLVGASLADTATILSDRQGQPSHAS